jgi:hypothetical protein
MLKLLQNFTYQNNNIKNSILILDASFEIIR